MGRIGVKGQCSVWERMAYVTEKSAITALALLFSVPASAEEFQLSVYGGLFDSTSSRVSGIDPTGTGSFDFDGGWTAGDGSLPPTFGVRGTWWQTDTTGYSLDFTRLQATADDGALVASGFSVLEFDDGINTVTVNARRRFPMGNRWTPFVAGGVGVAVPGVDIQTSPTGASTTEYQYGGIVAQFQGGVEYEVNENWSVFGQYQMNVIDLDVDLNGGGNLSTGIVTNSVSVGAGFSF